MKALLLHGMGGQPAPDRIALLKEMGFESVVAPHLDYGGLGINKIFEILRELIEHEGIEVVVGNSRGGFYAYWLAEEYGLDCVVFNPSIPRFYHNEKYESLPKKCGQCVVVTGLKDDCVLTESVMLYFKEKVHTGLNPVIRVEPQLEHRVPIEYFKTGMKLLSLEGGNGKGIQ